MPGRFMPQDAFVCITPDGTNANLGPSPVPEPTAFLDAARERLITP